MFKIRCGIPNAYILDITMYKMHVSYILSKKIHLLYYITTPFTRSAISVFTECDKDHTVSIHERQVAQEQ